MNLKLLNRFLSWLFPLRRKYPLLTAKQMWIVSGVRKGK